MRPLFSRFGAKYRVARHLGPPRRDEVVEPFAGSACYSLFWEPKRVSLYDKDADVRRCWDWLLGCSVEDIMRLPAPIRSNEEWLALPDGPRQVIYWNVGFAQPRVGRHLPPWYLHYINTGERTGAMLGNNKWRSWDESNRALIARQRPKLDKWTFEQLDYRDIPLREAHWHVDPPYSGKPGRAYRHNRIDYADLARWCRSLPGAADVCENRGADWLPFEPLTRARTTRSGKEMDEMVWRSEPVDLLGLM